MLLSRLLSAAPLLCLELFWLQPTRLKGAPVVLQAYTVIDESSCQSSASGDDFSFSQQINFGCAGNLNSAAGISLPGDYRQSTATFMPSVGTINAAENPEKIAAAYEKQFQGSLYLETGAAIPHSFSGTVGFKPAATGRLQVCLSAANYSVVACDPAFVNFAVIDLNVAGQDVYTVTSGNVQGEDFPEAAATVPEPNLWLFECAALLLFTIAGQRKRFPVRRNQEAPLTPA